MKSIEGFIHRILLGYKVDEAILLSMKKIQILKKIDEIIAIMIYDSMYRKAHVTKTEHRMYAVNAIMPVENSIVKDNIRKQQYDAIAIMPVESRIAKNSIRKQQYDAIAIMPTQYDKTKKMHKKEYEVKVERV